MNNLKKYFVFAALLIVYVSNAQHKPDRDKIAALKVAYITEKLDLTTQEAQVFWPIYNTHEKDMEALRQKDRTLIRGKLSDVDAMSEKEAQKLLKQYIAFEEEEDKLDSAFYERVGKEISAKKSMLLLRAKEDFKRHLIKQYRSKKNSGNQRP